MRDVQWFRIHITAEAIHECEGNVRLVTIARKDIERVRLIHDGVISEHPFFLWLVGVGCVVTAIVGAYLFVRGGWKFPKTAGAMIALALVSPFALAAAVRRGAYLEVTMKRGSKRKLGFGGKSTADELARFIEAASARAQLQISAELPRAAIERR